MNLNRTMAAIVLAAILAASVPSMVLGSSSQLTDSLKLSVEKAAAAADAALKSRIIASFNELSSLLAQESALDGTIKNAHYGNEEAIIAVRKQITGIDADKVAQLEKKLQMTKDKYKPMFVLYSSVSGTKSATAEMRLAVQLAREDIKLKEKQLKAAKDEKARKIKDIRAILAGIDSVKVQIKSAKSALDIPKKRYSAEWSDFKQLLQKKEAKRTADSLSVLVSLTRQAIDQKKGIHTLELKISGIIAKARAQIPAK
ncbi:hypothetical protein [Paenibacillus sp. YPG26]|uniref:hypothetical protein n=1 Tax=Paenibacillus sp. YPG26 TaxID=2878915 RepID=UPI00203D8370|nr:hypothetical protein [Paenibacillus sp. YPG26]USB33565.1 hypothetical protein LDO05_01685 [Paenibacillus sp. YPG26]